jgi:hypothetical protein
MRARVVDWTARERMFDLAAMEAREEMRVLGSIRPALSRRGL